MKDGVIIIGAGGHAKVVLSTLTALQAKIAGFVDDNTALLNQTIHGYPVLGKLSLLADVTDNEVIFGIGDNFLRKKITMQYPHLNWKTAIHPAAFVHPSVRVGKGSVVFAGGIIQIDAMIGDHVIINTAASVDHDCQIMDFVHVAPGTHLAGNVSIHEGVFLGINSCAIYGISVGAWTTIGAGSVIVRSIESEVYAKGIPAKAYKTLNEKKLLSIK